MRASIGLLWNNMAPGITDDAVLELANRQRAPLLTADKDFGELIFRQRRLAPGIVLLRLAGMSSAGKAELVAATVEEHLEELTGAFTVIAPGAIRIRGRRD
jgi:predicted nuclease of predicted toxin-antitoxin system